MDNLKTSVFKRPARLKKSNRLGPDGNPKMVKIKSAWIYRIRYIDDEGKPRTEEKGFRLEAEAKDALTVAVSKLQKSGGASRTGDKMTFNDLVRCFGLTISPVDRVKFGR